MLPCLTGAASAAPVGHQTGSRQEKRPPSGEGLGKPWGTATTTYNNRRGSELVLKPHGKGQIVVGKGSQLLTPERAQRMVSQKFQLDRLLSDIAEPRKEHFPSPSPLLLGRPSHSPTTSSTKQRLFRAFKAKPFADKVVSWSRQGLKQFLKGLNETTGPPYETTLC